MNTVITLHNVPNVEGSTRVLDNLWTGGDITQYLNDS